MVEDEALPATEFIEFVLKENLIIRYRENPIMLQSVLDYCLTNVDFVPCVYQPELKQ